MAESTYNKYRRQNIAMRAILSSEIKNFLLDEVDWKERLSYLKRCIAIYRHKMEDVMETKQKISDKDLRLTILGCFRYSLGRMTYMPSHTVMIIKNNREIFREHDWKSFIDEIDDCKNLGMDCNKETWEELRSFSEEMLGK